MELHVWSSLPGAPSLDPECLAAVYQAQKSVEKVEIYASGAVHLSPTNTLPLLIDGDVRITGFVEIAERLGHIYEPLDLALVAYLQKLSVITQWSLFLIKENYEGLVRPQISAEIPFPMQYNAALSLQKHAQYLQPDKPRKKEEGLSKLHTAMLEKNAAIKAAQETPRTTLKRMAQLSEILETAKEVIKPGSASELLLTANIVLLTLGSLPLRPLESIILTDDWANNLRSQGITNNLQVEQSLVPEYRQYSLKNVAWSYLA